MGFIYQYTIIGETPAKKNSRVINTKTGRSFPSKTYTAWHKDALLQIMGKRPKEPINKPVLVHLVFTHGDYRRRDSDNGCSSIMDLLTDAGVLIDDNWQIVRDIAITNRYEKNAPKCEITIQEL